MTADQAPDAGAPEQLELLRAQVRGRRPRPPAPLAAVDAVARVVLDVPLPHLDRPFDYAVPATMDAAAVPGARVRVRFAGKDADGFVVARRATSDHAGRLLPLRAAPSGEPVLDEAVLEAARAVAQRYAGALADVLRLAVPPRHATTEKKPGTPAGPSPERPAPGPWDAYPGGAAFLSRLGAGEAPRAVWTALPGGAEPQWPRALAVAAATALSSGRGTVIVVPDHRDVVRVESALTALLGDGAHVRLTADAGPAARYEAFLRLRRGQVRIAVGTRAAAFAPVQQLGLVACWDDGDDLLREQRAPYPHARDVLITRADLAGAAALVGSLSRSVDAQQLVESGWARDLAGTRAGVRAVAPRVVVSGDDDLRDPAARSARLPSLALRTARDALLRGPVLVQVPRAGYVPALGCQDCRAPARCAACHGPLELGEQGSPPRCRWCGRLAGDWSCRSCHGHRLRSVVVGSARTAEELARSFAGTTVKVSGGSLPVMSGVPDRPALVVATPGAEPPADGGYAAALLLDTWSPLARPDLRAAEEAVRRWLGAAALVRPAGEGGTVVVVGDPGLSAIQALVRWDPAGYAARELQERRELALPPAVTMAEVRGTATSVRALLAVARLPEQAQVLGPVRVEASARWGAEPPQDRRSARAPDGEPDDVRALVRVPREQAGLLSEALAAARAVLSAARQHRLPRVQVDPEEIG